MGSYGDRLFIYATRPKVPFRDLECYVSFKVCWIDSPSSIIFQHWNDRNIECFFHTGWRRFSLLMFDVLLKLRGVRTAIIVDNPLRRTFKQRLGRIACAVLLNRVIDKVVVVGRASSDLVLYLGFDEEKILGGGYGASRSIYYSDPVLHRRNEFIFVGQLIPRKGVELLLRAYVKYRSEGGEWGLSIIGDGPLKDVFLKDGIKYFGFLQPNEVARELRLSQCLVLPSRLDHWGTIVCEAMACGCMAIVSDRVYSHLDLVKDGVNGKVFPYDSMSDLVDALRWAESLSAERRRLASAVSMEMADKFNDNSYLKMFNKLLEA